MEMQNHPLSSLFEQLGLQSSEQAIEKFIKSHAPIGGETELHEAKFWNPSQAAFLKEAKDNDADWAEIVDQLDAMLRTSHQ